MVPNSNKLKSQLISMSVTFIDLFAGIGGMRFAFERAGCVCIFSSEIDKFACETYSKNFGDSPAGDIQKIDEEEIPDHDITLAGFPCQPFSLSGVSKRNSLGRPHGLECEKKGQLFLKIFIILKIKKPKAFLLENVKHLRFHNKGKTFGIIKDYLEEAGYDVYAEVIDASSAVPQHRERIYIVGFRKDMNIKFNFPKFQDSKPFLKDILEAEVDPKYTLSDKLWEYLRNYREKHKKRGNGFGYSLTHPNGITRTLSSRYYKDGSEILIPQEGKNPRRLTPRECARLMGFPDNYQIPVSDTQAYKQFGNSVAVPIVEKIAWKIVECLRLNGSSSQTTYMLRQ